MDPLAELLAVDHRQALSFFVLRLQDISEPSVDKQELLYNASLLAHYTQVSTTTSDGFPAPTSLSTVFDHFIADTTMHHDSAMMETAGAQCLLLTGFFEDQMRGRHNIHWYAKIGAGFFTRASLKESSVPKARLLEALAQHFEPWRQRHAQLSRDLRDQPYLMPSVRA